MSSPVNVSTVLDTFNHAAFVVESVATVRAQRRPSDELIVVDDGSTDDTPAHLGVLTPAVRVIRRPNGGQGAALNTGIAAATGDWVAFLDGDDRWGPAHLEQVTAAIRAHPKVDAIFTPIHEIDAAGARGRVDPPTAVQRAIRRLLQDPTAPAAGRLPWFPPTSGLVVRRALLQRVGPIPERYRIAADGWLQIAIAIAARRIVLLDHPTAELRLHGGNHWTPLTPDTAAIAARRAELYGWLAEDARALGGACGRDVSGLVRSITSQQEEFAIWAAAERGRRWHAAARAIRWPAPAYLPSRTHAAFRRAGLLLGALIPRRWYLRLRGGWRALRVRITGGP